MASFFKTLGKGIIYVVTFPLLVVFLVGYFIVSLFSFIVIGIKGLILFFKGENIVGEMSEDIEAKKRLAILQDPISLIQQEINKNTAPVQTIIKQDAIETSAIEQRPYLQISENKHEPLPEPEPTVEESKIAHILEPNDTPINEDEISPTSFQDTLNKIGKPDQMEEVKIDNTNRHVFESDEYIEKEENTRPTNTVSSYDEEGDK